MVAEPRPLRYHTLLEPTADVPGFVRAASAIRRVGSRLLVVQDDVNAFAEIDDDGRTAARLLPAGTGGTRTFDDLRGNKRRKLDLEAAVALPDGRVLLFGSGSSPNRERIVVFDGHDALRLRRAPGLYARLRGTGANPGLALNVEGAVVQGERLRLLHRAVGRSRRDASGVNLVLDLAVGAVARWIDGKGRVPEVLAIVEVDLGTIDGVPLGFTDAAALADGRIAFVACAENTADPRADGPVTGCCFGWLHPERAELTDVVDSTGRLSRLKLEGIEPRAGSVEVFDVVADLDRPDEPAVRATLCVTRTFPHE